MRDAVKQGTELGRRAESFMTKGELVPDEVVTGIVAARLQQPDCVNGFMLDGFPRTEAQARALDAALRERGRELDAVISFELDDGEIVRRLSGRRVCGKCGSVYNAPADSVTDEGVCDRCGGKLITRADDRPEAVRRRLQVYGEQTEPLINYYRRSGILVGIPAAGSIEEVFSIVKQKLEDVRGRRD